MNIEHEPQPILYSWTSSVVLHVFRICKCSVACTMCRQDLHVDGVVTVIYSVDIINDSACVVHAIGVAVNNGELQISRFDVLCYVFIMFKCNYVHMFMLTD